jgi:hypothetical protein
MHLYRNWNFLDYQEEWKEIKRIDLRKPHQIDHIMWKYKLAVELALNSNMRLINWITLEIYE